MRGVPKVGTPPSVRVLHAMERDWRMLRARKAPRGLKIIPSHYRSCWIRSYRTCAPIPNRMHTRVRGERPVVMVFLVGNGVTQLAWSKRSWAKPNSPHDAKRKERIGYSIGRRTTAPAVPPALEPLRSTNTHPSADIVLVQCQIA
jgi:hypothetical protein